jgi:hypothetical protein
MLTELLTSGFKFFQRLQKALEERTSIKMKILEFLTQSVMQSPFQNMSRNTKKKSTLRKRKRKRMLC